MDRLKINLTTIILNIFVIFVLSVFCFTFSFFSITGISILVGGSSSEGSFVSVILGSIGAIFFSLPLSLYPSYRISLWLSRKVKDWWGWEIEKPKKFFWLSVLLIILLVFVLPFVVNSLF